MRVGLSGNEGRMVGEVHTVCTPNLRIVGIYLSSVFKWQLHYWWLV